MLYFYNPKNQISHMIQVEQIVQCASKHKFVLIPFGGGTSVSGSITCPAHECRPIVSLDTSDMNSILWLDREQLLARVQVSESSLTNVSFVTYIFAEEFVCWLNALIAGSTGLI